MIRIRLINEGKVVKQITSRIHEGVVLEQIKNYKDPYDTIQVVEGELSEDAKSMLQHVARKIVPAAMAAGVALSGAGNAQAQGSANPNYPGLNHSVGQHMVDIFSPNYKEMMRQREHRRNTERQVWNAEQDEIRKQRVADARARVRPAPGQQHVVYDQSRISQDGKSYIIYGMDNKVRRIPVNGTEYMPGDSQRLPHYITSGGGVFYVRHPHMNESIRESAENKAEHDKGYSDASQGKSKNPYNPGSPAAAAYDAGQQAYRRHFSEAHQIPGKDEHYALRNNIWTLYDGDEIVHEYRPERGEVVGAKKLLARFDDEGYDVTHVVSPMGVATYLYGKPEEDMDEGYTVTRGIDRERYQERPGLEGPFSTRSGKVVYYDPKEGKYYDPETDFYIGHEDYAKMDEEATPGVVKAAAGLTLGGIAAAGAPALIGILGPVVGIPFAAYAAYSAAKLGMKGVEKLWDMASEKLGGDDKVAQYANAKLAKLPPDQARAAAAVVKQIGESKQSVAEGDPNATVGTISSTGTSGGTGRTQFAPTGKTTNAKFNKNGQIELDTEQEDDGSVNLDADAVKQLQQAGVKIKESEDSPVASAIARRIMSQRLDLLQNHGPQKVMAAIDDVADFVGDTEEIGSSDVSAWVKQVEQTLAGMGESVNEGTDTLEGILSKFSADYAKFKAGGDIDENQDFFDALYEYFFDEMPYGVKKARDGDPYEWITDRLDQESGIAPVAEAEEDEATPGDQAAADQNIIMQIRKASDYEKPTKIKLADGSENVIAPNIAKLILAKFDKMKPESKALLQDTLNTEEGFKEILAYFGGGVREQAVARASKVMAHALEEAGLADIRARMDARRDHPEKQSPNPTTPMPPVPPYVAPAKQQELKAGDIIGYRPKNAKMVPIKAKVLKLLSGDRAMVSVSSPTMIARNNDSPVITIGPLSDLDIQNPYKAIARESVVNEAAADWLPAYNGLLKGDGEPARGGSSQNLNWKKSMALVAKDTGITDWNQLMNFVQQYASNSHNKASRENLERWQQLTNEIASLMKQAPTMDEMRAAIKQQDADKHQQNLTAIQQQLDLENAPLQHEMSVQALINKAELDKADQKELLELDMEARLAIMKIKQDMELDAKERLTQIEREIEDRKEREDVRKHELEMAQAGYKHELAVINASAEGEYKKAKLEADYQIQIKQLDNIDNAGERQNRLDQINTEKAKQLEIIDAETKARVEVMQKEVDVEKQQSDIKINQAFMMTLNPIWGAALTAAHAAGSTWKAGINNLNKALAMLSKPVMPTAQKESRYDRRDAYQRDYDSSVAGMGKRQSLAYQLDGGANDEGWDQPERSYQVPQQTYYIRFKDSGKVYKQKGVPKSFANKAAANAYALAMIKNNPAHQDNILLTVSSEDKPSA